MKRILTLMLIFFSVSSLLGCANMSNQDAGAITGAVAGGLIGSTVGKGGGQLVAIAAGSLAGAYIGGSVGRSMDAQDRARMYQALENNSVGQPAYWRNENNDVSYEVVPTRNITVRGNDYCREYRTIANIAGKRQQVYGTACRQPDGTWKAAN